MSNFLENAYTDLNKLISINADEVRTNSLYINDVLVDPNGKIGDVGPQGPVGPGPGPKGVIVGYEPTPQTPEQVADGLKEAFRESVKQGVVSSTTKAQNLYDIICDCMVKYNSTVYPGLICDILDAVDEWLPKEQSANSQNVDVEFLVEGFNDAIKKIKGKLR